MTREEQQHKLKLIALIILVETEKFRKTKFDTIFGMLTITYGIVWWAMEYRRVSEPIYPKSNAFPVGGFIVGEPDNEIIIRKDVKFGKSPLDNQKLITALNNIKLANRVNNLKSK